MLTNRNPKSNIAAAIALFFAAPFVAEYLLGNLPIQALGLIVVEAPLYGGGALLIREVVRRTGREWPSIILLGLAYSVLEEGFLTQSLFNPDFMHLHLHLLESAYIPTARIGGWWTLWMLNVHAVWSIATPIALVESCWIKTAKTPWLKPFGLGVTLALFVAGCFMTASFTAGKDRFTASPIEFAGAGVVCGVLILLAMFTPQKRKSVENSSAPQPWLCALFALVLGSAALCTPNSWGWGAVVIMLLCDLIALVAVLTFSRCLGWTPRHKLALAAGAVLAYGWHAFLQTPVFGTGLVVRVGNGVFLATALGIIWLASKRMQAANLNRSPLE